MGFIALCYGAGAFAVLGLSWLAWRADALRYGDAFACAAMLVVTWAISNTLTTLYSPPECWLFYPVMDAVCGAVVVWMYASAPPGTPQTWKFLLAGLFLFQCLLHVAFWAQQSKAPSLLYIYALALNISFACQLLVTAWPGGTYAADRLADFLGGPVRAGMQHSARDRAP